jgi:hypothetical protein
MPHDEGAWGLWKLGTYFELEFVGVLVLVGTVIVLEAVVLQVDGGSFVPLCGLLLPLPLETFVAVWLDVRFPWLWVHE